MDLLTLSNSENRGIFRTQVNIYDGVFLRKQITAKNHQLFSQKPPSQVFNWVLKTCLENNCLLSLSTWWIMSKFYHVYFHIAHQLYQQNCQIKFIEPLRKLALKINTVFRRKVSLRIYPFIFRVQKGSYGNKFQQLVLTFLKLFSLCSYVVLPYSKCFSIDETTFLNMQEIGKHH